MTAPYDGAFYTAQGEGSLASARVVLREAFRLLGRPRSLVDVGCGLGTWLSAAGELGCARLLGLDGEWVPREQLLVAEESFVPCDLATADIRATAAAHAPGPFELAISMEVAEHLPPPRAVGFVAALCGLADAVLFSAAIPMQGGTDHLNEQWPEYWATLFARQGYRCFDLLRPVLWAKPGIEWWYVQNALFFTRRDSVAETVLRRHGPAVRQPQRLVHPTFYQALAEFHAAATAR